MNVATFNGRRLDWRALLALVLVPLLVAGGVLAGTWNFGRDLHKVQAAIVNLDEMVTLKGQSVPLGRQLSAALIDSKRGQNFTWVLADASSAAKGLASGRFAAVVTIPSDFSARATSYAGTADAARQARIDIVTSPVAGIAETALGQSVADAATRSLNESLTSMYLDNVFIGFTTMGKQFVTVADGAQQLADGSSKLTDGLGQAADGGDQLASGLGQAASGGKTLSDAGAPLSSGASQLASGMNTMAAQTAPMPAQIKTMSDGANSLASGMTQYVAGVDQYVDGINSIVDPLLTFAKQLPDLTALFAQVDTLMTDLPAKAVTLDDQVQAAVGTIRTYLGDAAKLQAAASTLLGQLSGAKTVTSGLASGATTVDCPASLADVAGACEAFAKGVRAGGAAASDSLSSVDAGKVSAASATLSSYSGQIDDALDKLSAASAWFRTNAATLQAQWQTVRAMIPAGTSPNAYLVDQLTLLRDGGNQLKTGGHQLSDGMTALAGGIQQLNDGLPALVGGIQAAADGATKLSDGVGQYTAGATLLIDGITAAHDGSLTLASGMHDAASGSAKLTDGMSQLASGLADGAKQIPSYTDAEASNLAKVVASPIASDGLDTLITPEAATASLLLVLALWLGTLATFALIKPVDPRNAASSSTTAHLVARALLPGALVASVQAVLLGALGAAYASLDAQRAAGLIGALLVAGLAFTAVNHALAAWAGVWGRLVSGAMLLVTTVCALTYSAPGIFATLRPLSPLSPALDAVRAAVTWQSGALMVVTLIGWGLLGLLAGAWRIARSRTVSVKSLALAAA
jgi:putative membrane protein